MRIENGISKLCMSSFVIACAFTLRYSGVMESARQTPLLGISYISDAIYMQMMVVLVARDDNRITFVFERLKHWMCHKVLGVSRHKAIISASVSVRYKAPFHMWNHSIWFLLRSTGTEHRKNASRTNESVFVVFFSLRKTILHLLCCPAITV